MTSLVQLVQSGFDFLQHNTLAVSLACMPVPSNFTHLKLETYDGSTDPTQHMMRFTLQMYVYNASDNICCRIFPSSLIGKALAWYAHLPPRSISSFKDLGRNLSKISYLNLYSSRHRIFYSELGEDHLNMFVILQLVSIKWPRKFLIFLSENTYKVIDIASQILHFLENQQRMNHSTSMIFYPRLNNYTC